MRSPLLTSARGPLRSEGLKKIVTGTANLDVTAVAGILEQIRRHTDLPIGVGFGIRDAASAAQVAKVADAVVVGSAIVRRIADLAQTPERIAADIGAVLREMRQAMDQSV